MTLSPVLEPVLRGISPTLGAGVGGAVSDGIDYHVDSVGGSDSGAGTLAAPFQTLAKLKTVLDGTTGKVAGFKRGSVWKEEFSLTTTNGVYLAYGTGAAPLFDGSDVLLNASFTLSAAQTFTYQISGGTPAQTSASEFRNVWENGKYLQKVASIAACEALSGSCYVNPATGSGAVTIYVHAYDNSNVTSNGKTYEWSARLLTFDAQGNGNRVGRKVSTGVYADGIRTRRQRTNDGSLRLAGTGCKLYGCTIDDGGKHSCYVSLSPTVEGNTFSNAYNGPSGNPNLLVVNADVGDGLGGSIAYNTFQTTDAVVQGGTLATGETPTGILSHINTSGNFGRPTLSHNTYTKLDTAITLADVTGIDGDNETFTDCYIEFNSPSIPATHNFTDCVIAIPTGARKDGGANDWNRLVNGGPSSGASIVNFTRLTLTGIYAVKASVVVRSTINFISSSLAAGSTSGDAPFWTDGGAANSFFSFNGCTIKLPRSGAAFTAYETSNFTYVSSNNNIFDKNGFSPVWKAQFASVATTIAGWRTYSGQDAASTLP